MLPGGTTESGGTAEKTVEHFLKKYFTKTISFT